MGFSMIFPNKNPPAIGVPPVSWESLLQQTALEKKSRQLRRLGRITRWQPRLQECPGQESEAAEAGDVEHVLQGRI